MCSESSEIRRIRPRSAVAGSASVLWVLCVARPLSDCTLEVGVESHDKLCRNPFLDPLEGARAESGYRHTKGRINA